MYLSDDYRDIVQLFNEYKVRYLIAGAYAMSTFGYSRSTYDIDLWIDKSLDNVEKILKALSEFGLPFELQVDDLIKDNNVIQIGCAPLRIDILTNIDGVEFEEAYQNMQIKKLGDTEATVLNIDDIIKNKIATNRPKDRLDVEQLKSIKELSD